jgi:uncharacterized protein YjbI with pentapeptide repeats
MTTKTKPRRQIEPVIMNPFEIKPGADLSGTNYSNLDFYELFGLKGLNGGPGANLQRCIFKDANLHASRHYHSDFLGADLTGCDMSETHCFETSFGRRGFQENEFPALLLHANFDGAYLGGSNLNGVNASGASFIGANLVACQISGAVFSGADFSGANFTRISPAYNEREPIDFSFSNLEGADFSGADLSGANFFGANVTGVIINEYTNLRGAIRPDGSVRE